MRLVVFLALCGLCSGFNLIQDPLSVDWKPILDGNEDVVLKNYLDVISIRPLAASIWSKLSFYDKGKSRTIDEMFNSNEHFETRIHANLAKLVLIKDSALHCELSNKNGQGIHFYGPPKDLLRLNYKKQHLVCLIHGQIGKILENDCGYFNGGVKFESSNIDDHQIEALIMSWTMLEEKCPKLRPTILYDVLRYNDSSVSLMIHTGDKYLSSSISKEEFMKEIREDSSFGASAIPEWDDESQDAAEKLFALLDSNHDQILDLTDMKIFLQTDGIGKMNYFIEAISNEFQLIAFDMKIRRAGEMDFTLPKEEVEQMVARITARDLAIYLKLNAKDDLIIKDEL